MHFSTNNKCLLIIVSTTIFWDISLTLKQLYLLLTLKVFDKHGWEAWQNIFKISWKCIIWRKTNTFKDYKRGFEDVVLIQLIDECTSGVSSALIGRNQNLIGLHPYYYTRGCWWILKVGIHGVKSTLLWIETSVVKGFFSKILILEDNF